METLIKKLVNAKSGEVRALLWSFAYFFFLLSSYYILRPLRDEMGVAGGTRNLPWLFTATFIALLVAAPLLAAAVAKLPRVEFIPIVYLFFVANILIFWVLLQLRLSDRRRRARVLRLDHGLQRVHRVGVLVVHGRPLFQRAEQAAVRLHRGRRLARHAARARSSPASWPCRSGLVNLLLIAAVLLAIAVFCANRLGRPRPRQRRPRRRASRRPAPAQEKQPVGGGLFDGFSLLFKSPYLGGIALWVFLLSLAGTFLYLQAGRTWSRPPRTIRRTRPRIFATIDLWVGILTMLMQFLATGRLISKFGTGPAAAFLPLVFVVGFVVLAIHPVLLVVAVFQAAQRATNFGIANPARESLFTVVSREEKFKTKNIIDGAVFRGADALNALGVQDHDAW